MKRPCSGWQPAFAFLVSLWLGLCSPFASKAQTLGPSLVADQARVFSAVATPGTGSLADLVEYTDAAGNTYQAATFIGTVQFGAFPFTSPASNDYEVVVAKRDAAGSYQWAVAGGGIGTQRAKALAVDATGNVYVTGFFDSATASFGATTLNNASPANKLNKDVFVFKLSANGNWQWAASAGGGNYLNGEDMGASITVDALAGVHVAGTFDSSVAFFGSLQTPNPSPYGGPIGFVAKLSSGGNWQWVRTANVSGNTPTHVKAEPGGNVYLAGETSGYVHFGSFLLLNPGSVTTTFIAKLDAAGNWLWLTKTLGPRSGGGSSLHHTLVLDNQQGAYLTGEFNCDTLRFGTKVLKNSGNGNSIESFVAKLNTNTGLWRWAAQTKGQANELLTDALLDGTGHLYVGGSFTEGGSQDPGTWPRYGNTVLHSAGGRDLAIAQLDTAGAWQWARRVGGTAHEQGGPSYMDGQGQVFVDGTFEGSTLLLGTTTLAAAPTASFYGNTTFARTAFRTRLGSNALVAVNPTAGPSWEVYPNPARTRMTVLGLAAGQQVELLDALGRRVLQATVPARGPLQVDLPLGLAAGLYLVRAAGQARRVAVE